MATFQYSGGLRSDWAASNRVLVDGELARTTDTDEIRIGNGTNTWSATNPFKPSPTPEWFNVSSDTLRNLRLIVARARNGSGAAPIIVMGASMEQGVPTGGYQQSYPLFAVHAIWGRGIAAGGSGWVPAYSNSGDTRWTSRTFGATPPAGAMYMGSTAANQVMTFVSDATGNLVKVAVLSGGGTFTVAIDGTAQTLPAATTTNGISVYSWDTGLIGIHTVTVTATTATAVNLVAVRVHKAAGAELHNFAISGGTSFGLLPTGATGTVVGSPGQSIPALLPTTAPGGLVLIGLDPILNDGLGANGVSQVTTSKPRFASAITGAQTDGHQVMVMLPPYPNPAGSVPTATWEAVRQMAYELGVTYGVPVMDMSYRWKDYATASAAGYMADDFHSTPLGYQDWASSLAALLSTGTEVASTQADPGPQLGTLTNGVTAFGNGYAKPGYQKLPNGYVALSGMAGFPVSGVGAGIYGMTLPAGYRVAQTRRFVVSCQVTDANGVGTGCIDVRSDGTCWMFIPTQPVTPAAGGTYFFSLEGVQFPAEQ